MEEQIEISRKKSPTTSDSQLHFIRMKAFLVASDFRHFHKKLELKIVNMDMSKAAQIS